MECWSTGVLEYWSNGVMEWVAAGIRRSAVGRRRHRSGNDGGGTERGTDEPAARFGRAASTSESR
jgi:hypothetical protein